MLLVVPKKVLKRAMIRNLLLLLPQPSEELLKMSSARTKVLSGQHVEALNLWFFCLIRLSFPSPSRVYAF
jgi:hypothetical protein